MKLLKALLFAVLALPLMGLLVLGALVSAGLAMRHYGSFGGFTGLIALILYGAVIGLPLSLALQWLARRLI